jgi:hypothetical protein
MVKPFVRQNVLKDYSGHGKAVLKKVSRTFIQKIPRVVYIGKTPLLLITLF